MGEIVLDASKVNSFVLSNLSKTENTMQIAYSTSVSLKNSIPNSFGYRSTINEIVNQIYNIKKKIKSVSLSLEKKLESANRIQQNADNKVRSLSSSISKVAIVAAGAAIGASTGGVVGSVIGVATGAALGKTVTKTNNNTGAKQSKGFVSAVKGFFVNAWEGIKDTAAKIAKAVKSIWEKFSGAIKNIGNTVAQATKKVGKVIYSTGAKVAKGIVSGVKKVGSAIVDGFKWVGSKVVSGVKTAAKWVKDTSKTVTNWVVDKFNAVKDWTCKAIKDTGAWISKAAKASWTWIKDTASTVWTHMKKIGASFVNGVIALTKGLVRLVEALGDLVILIGSGISTIGTALYDIGKGLCTGNWDWSATKGLWKGTKAVVAYDCTSKIYGNLYDTKFGRWVDYNAYAPFKSDGIGCKILEGVGYVAGVVVLSIVTFGAAGVAFGASATVMGVTVNAGTVALTATVAGIGKYTQEEWNKNSLSITYGGQEVGLTIDYEKYCEIEKLGDEQSTTIIQQLTDENGNPFELKFTITKNGDTYSITDGNGNAVGFNGVTESSTVKGLAMGSLKGLGDGLKYYTAVSTIGNVQQFTSMAKSIGGGNTLQGFKSMFKNFGLKQSLKPLATTAAKNTFTDIGFYIDSGSRIYTSVSSDIKTGDLDLLKTGSKIFGSIATSYGINFLGNLGGEYFSKGLDTSLQKDIYDNPYSLETAEVTGIGTSGKGLRPEDIPEKVRTNLDEDSDAVFGYSSHSKTWGESDWTDTESVLRNRRIREKYLLAEEESAKKILELREKGYSDEEIAIFAVNSRNQNKIITRSEMTVSGNCDVAIRNVIKYGKHNLDGPTMELLQQQRGDIYKEALKQFTISGISDPTDEMIYDKAISLISDKVGISFEDGKLSAIGPDLEWSYKKTVSKLKAAGIANPTEEMVYEKIIGASLRTDPELNALLGLKKWEVL